MGLLRVCSYSLKELLNSILKKKQKKTKKQKTKLPNSPSPSSFSLQILQYPEIKTPNFSFRN